jgi:hypothetical protein
LKSLINEKTIIIEDYAHRLFAELPLKQTTNHYFIDSIRKHCSLLGAHLLNFNGRVAGVKKINHYKLACIFYRFWQNRLFDLAYIFSAPSLYQWGFKFFLKLNNLIGEPVAPTTGTWFSFLAYNFLNLKKIRKNYNEILLSYNEKIALLPDIYIKKLNSTALIESGIATYYPLLVSKAIREQLLTFLETDGIFAFQIWNWEEKTGRKELNRELHESLIVFPLSVLITKSDIDYIFEKMKTFFANLSYVENKNE